MHVNQLITSIQDPCFGQVVLDLSPSRTTWQSTLPVSPDTEALTIALGWQCCSKLPQTEKWPKRNLERHTMTWCSLWKDKTFTIYPLAAHEKTSVWKHRNKYIHSVLKILFLTKSEVHRVHNSTVKTFRNVFTQKHFAVQHCSSTILAEISLEPWARRNHKGYYRQPHLSPKQAIPPHSSSLAQPTAHLRYLKLVPPVAELNASSFLGVLHSFTHCICHKLNQPCLKPKSVVACQIKQHLSYGKTHQLFSLKKKQRQSKSTFKHRERHNLSCCSVS